MIKTLNEEDFLYPKKTKKYSTTEIRGLLYYYAINPYKNNRLYGRTVGDLQNRILEETERVRSYFEDNTDFKNALLLWVTYLKYDSAGKKDRLRTIINKVNEINDNLENNPFLINYKNISENDIQLTIDTVIQNYDEAISKHFFEDMLIFITCLNWLGLKLDKKKISYSKKIQKPQIESEIRISKQEIELFDKEVFNNNFRSTGTKRYIDGALVPLITLHTGLYSKKAFLLNWNQIDFDKKIIVCDKKEYPLDEFLLNILNLYHEQKEVKGFPKKPLFKNPSNSDNEDFGYEGILSTYRRIKKNCLITKDISLRDLQLIKGKQLLDEGKTKEEVSNLLDLTIGKALWQKMLKFTIYDESVKYDYTVKTSSGDTFLIEVDKATKNLSYEKKEELLRYIEFLKQK